jgi:hypothetical protein
MKLRPFALGIALGSVWSAALFITTLLSIYTGYGKSFLEAIPLSLYPGYSISPLGSLLGLIYGFFDGLISGTIIGWIYNIVVK